ncbi:unnamed protein product, partial [Amoebophrya sp. A120]
EIRSESERFFFLDKFIVLKRSNVLICGPLIESGMRSRVEQKLERALAKIDDWMVENEEMSRWIELENEKRRALEKAVKEKQAEFEEKKSVWEKTALAGILSARAIERLRQREIRKTERMLERKAKKTRKRETMKKARQLIREGGFRSSGESTCSEEDGAGASKKSAVSRRGRSTLDRSRGRRREGACSRSDKDSDRRSPSCSRRSPNNSKLSTPRTSSSSSRSSSTSSGSSTSSTARSKSPSTESDEEDYAQRFGGEEEKELRKEFKRIQGDLIELEKAWAELNDDQDHDLDSPSGQDETDFEKALKKMGLRDHSSGVDKEKAAGEDVDHSEDCASRTSKTSTASVSPSVS